MVRCGNCKRECHNRTTCHRYNQVPAPVPFVESESESESEPEPELDGARSSPQPNVQDFPIQKAKLNTDLKKKIIRRFESVIRRLFKEHDVEDPHDVKFDELSNKYWQEEFNHRNGLVDISDMKTVMSTKYISRLFDRNDDVKHYISYDINEYLESFEGDDGFDDW